MENNIEHRRNAIAFFIQDEWCKVERMTLQGETTYFVKYKSAIWLVEFTSDPFASMITDERRAEALRGFAIGVLKMQGLLES